MEFRRLLILYLGSQIANIILSIIFSVIILSIYSIFKTTQKEHILFIMANAGFFLIVALVNLSMYLTLVEAYIDYKISVFNKVVKANYFLLALYFVIDSISLITNSDILSFVSAFAIVPIGFISINESQKYYQNWVLEEYNND